MHSLLKAAWACMHCRFNEHMTLSQWSTSRLCCILCEVVGLIGWQSLDVVKFTPRRAVLGACFWGCCCGQVAT